MARSWIRAVRAGAVLAAILCTSCAGPPRGGQGPHASVEPPAGSGRCDPPVTYQIFENDAFGSAWSKVNERIAFNAKGGDGLYHLYTVRPDGTDRRQLGAGSAGFPSRTTGSPVWSPSGRFIAFVAEKVSHPGSSAGATPGWGSYSDLWVATADGSQAWQLTDVPPDADHGTIIPAFSPDGRLLAWTERTAAGKILNPNRFAGFWAIKVARFDVAPDGTPSLSAIRTVSPPGNAFNETGGFSPDSASLVFTSDYESHNFWQNQIYRLELSPGTVTRLTRGDNYNEHPRYTPAGQVLWMTNAGNPQHGTDWWTMDPDGSNARRLSDFNSDHNSRGFGGKQVYACAVESANWSSDGRFFFGDVETNLLTSDSVILRVSLRCPNR